MTAGLHARRARVVGLVALGILLAGGCGDEDSPDSAFIGTWQVLQGEARAMCSGITPPPSSLDGAQVKLSAGTDSPLQVDVRGCLLKFDISGQSAVARPNQTCTTTFEVMGNNLQIELMVAQATFVVEGTMGVLNMSGTANTGFLGNCPYTATATAAKTNP